MNETEEKCLQIRRQFQVIINDRKCTPTLKQLSAVFTILAGARYVPAPGDGKDIIKAILKQHFDYEPA